MTQIMGFMTSEVYKRAKAFSKLAKVAEFQNFAHCITSKIKKNKIKQKNKVDLYKSGREISYIIYPA